MTTLYVKTHNVTGLKYFGKTMYDINSKDFKKYKGSGKYWVNHLKVHGKDVTTEIHAIFDEITQRDELVATALKFSEENNIVESKEWANMKPENGLDGNPIGTGPSRPIDREKWILNISESSKGMVVAMDINTGFSVRVKTEDFERYDHLVGINKGKKLTESHKEKIIASGRTHKQESKNKIGDAHRGKVVSTETKQKLSDRTITEEWRENSSVAAKNRPKICCPFCNKTGDISNMKRWHFDNCKLKGITHA